MYSWCCGMSVRYYFIIQWPAEISYGYHGDLSGWCKYIDLWNFPDSRRRKAL